MNIMKTQTKTTHMETGSIPKLLAQLAIPAVVAQVINLLYNIVDRIYIGHIPGIGAAALTGVGLFTPILMAAEWPSPCLLAPAVLHVPPLQWERRTMIWPKSSSETVLLCWSVLQSC